MTVEKPCVLLLGPAKPVIVRGLADATRLHVLMEAEDQERLLTQIAKDVRAIAIGYVAYRADAALMSRFPNLELVATFGVGYDHIDVAWAREHQITVTNTPDALTEEVADTALGLLLCTVRELPQAERHLRARKWLKTPYRLSAASMRNRTVGLIGMGRIGRAIARRLDAFGVPVVYHARRQQPNVTYRYYGRLLDMARDADTLLLIVPGGPSTRNLVDAEILRTLGANGILINMARGSVVDEAALVQALKDGTIMAAGLDVFENEPNVPEALLGLDNVVLLPHVGSRSAHTHAAMDQLVVDNILTWAAGRPPLTPVPETPLTSRA